MTSVKRKPSFKIEVIRPNYSSPAYTVKKRVVVFLASDDLKVDESNACTAYSFDETLHTVESSFSLTLTTEVDSDGLTWYDKIEKMDLINIYEFEELRFAGLVRSRRYSATLSGGKPSRTIQITGSGLGGMISQFKLVLDQFLYESSTTAEAASRKLMGRLSSLQDSENAPVAPLIIAIYDAYFELTQAIGELGGSVGLRGLIEHFVDVGSKLSRDVVLRYPMSFALYQVGENNVWDIISQIVVPPINELYGYWNPLAKKFEIVFRQAPFEPADWKALNTNEVPPVYLDDYNVGDSDAEVYTFYLGTLPGSGISRNKAMVYDSGAGKIGQIDSEKWKLYGYRPMIVDFRYFHREAEKTFGAATLMRELSEMMKRWFKNNDEFLSGTVTMMTPGNERYAPANPRVGEKLSFMQGEFYIEGVSHSWRMMAPMETELTVTRGYQYDRSGNMTGRIDTLGKKIRSAESRE